MNSSNIPSLQQEANNLNWIATMFIKYFCCVVIPPSVLGHIMSIYVFTRPSLRSNSCGMYFLFATIFGLFNASVTLPIRLVQSNYRYMDPSVYSKAICKTVWFLLYPIRSLAFWFIVLACSDRYLCTSAAASTRSWSNARVATRVIFLTIFINLLVYIHVPIFFEIGMAPITQKPVCYTTGPPGPYRIALNYINLIFFGLAPALSMLTFGMLTLQNLNQRKRIRAALSTNLQSKNDANARKKDRQMHRMLFVQVLVYSVTGLAFSITLIITTANSNHFQNVSEIAQGNLANAIVGVVSTVGPCFSFYLFTLSSSLFRKELKSLFNKFIRGNNQAQIDCRQAINTATAKC